MPIRDFPIEFPLRGLSENWSFDLQPPRTTRDAKNVRDLDPRTGRLRGGQRPGTKKNIAGLVSGAGNPVVNLTPVVLDDSQLTYSEFDNGDIEVAWEVATPGTGITTGPDTLKPY